MNIEEKLESLLKRVLSAQSKIVLPKKDGPDYYNNQKELLELINDISYAIRKRPSFYIKVNGGIEELNDDCTAQQVIEVGLERYWEMDTSGSYCKISYWDKKKLKNTLARLFEENQDEDFLKQMIYKDSRLVSFTKKFIDRKEEIYKMFQTEEMEQTLFLIHYASRVEGCENNEHNKKTFDHDFGKLIDYLILLRKTRNKEFKNCLKLAEQTYPQQMLIEVILPCK